MSTAAETQFTYDALEPLIARIDQDGERVTFTFRCPVTGLEQRASIIPGEAEAEVPTEEASAGFFGLLNALFGDEGVCESDSIRYDQDEIEEAAEWAFRAVASNFFWDGQRWTWWDANDAVLEFHEQMQSGPIEGELERDLLAGVLLQVIKADGVVTDDEVAYFCQLLRVPGPDLPDYPPLTERALRSIKDRRVRETILMLGYAMACRDQELAPVEEELLEVIAEGLEIPALRAWELRRNAQYYLVDEAFARSYHRGLPDPVKRVDALRLARGIGLDLEEAQRVEIRYRKREGIS